MKRGKVVAQFWATKRIDALPKGPLLEVELTSGGHSTASDPRGCGNGESVLITTGSVAAAWFGEKKTGVDAVIIGSLDE